MPANLMQKVTDSLMGTEPLNQKELSDDSEDYLVKKLHTETGQKWWEKKKTSKKAKISILSPGGSSDGTESTIKPQVFFTFVKVAKYEEVKQPSPPDTIVTWEDNFLCSAKSSDGYDLAYYLLHAISQTNVNMITTNMLEFPKVVPLHQGVTATSLNKVGSFIEVDGELAVEIYLVKGWTGIDQLAYFENVKPCSKFITKSGKSFKVICQMIYDLRLHSHCINDILKFADPEHHAELLKVKEKV
ncbi:hypothetical protein DEU56DRAFT_933686 [Suillus clintonianus]|uniref:uncharacterized protein n=1 Tax=Suillus clintonianus TaxID=1904413 RepID=UPI001B869125|nr:uncharacterized protein DEU56DRAFT_933686 [Suillus clintonianus]KAG2145915.1 hypothetical protein DEU56DRAFT_933686 [Suillus clintonianus]